MPRKRMIDPSIWASRSCALLSSDRRKLGFICLFSNADDEGKGHVSDLADKFHMDAAELQEACEDYQRANLAHFFWVQEGLDRVFCYQLPKWFKFQVVNRPSPSYIPNHPSFDTIVPKNLHPKYQTSNVEGISLIPFTESIHGGVTESIPGTDSRNLRTEAGEVVGGQPLPPKVPDSQDQRDLGEKGTEPVSRQEVPTDSLNELRESIHAERSKEVASLPCTTPIKASSTTCTILNSKKRANPARPLENGKENLPLFGQIYSWWQEISHGKPLASSKKTSKQMATLRSSIESLAEIIGAETMIDVAQITYRNKRDSKQDLPATLNYFLPMWRDIKRKSKKKSSPAINSAKRTTEKATSEPTPTKGDPVHVATALAGIKETIKKARGKAGVPSEESCQGGDTQHGGH